MISTASLIYIFFVPIVRLSKGSLPAAIIGNVIGKLSFLPVILLPIAKTIGKIIYPINVKLGHNSSFSFQKLFHGDFSSVVNLLHGGIHVLIGMSLFGVILGFLSYFVVHYLYEKEKVKRLNKVREKQHLRATTPNKNFT